MCSLNPKIGLVSGVGPLAGANVLEKIYRYAAKQYNAVEDAEYPEVVLINRGIEGVDNTATLNNNFRDGIVSIVKQLEQNGATTIGIACNTAHLFLQDIKTSDQVTIVNLIDEVSRCVSKTDKRYLLLTSASSRKQRLYHEYLDKYNVNYQEVNQDQQNLLDEAIGLVMAYKLKDAGKLLEKVLEQAKKDGFTAVIAGCTELPIAVENTVSHFGLDIVDSNYILASVLADNYYQSLQK